MRGEGERSAAGGPEPRVFGDVEAAAAAFEHLPLAVAVTDGPDLRTVAVNAAARALAPDRLLPGIPLREALPSELLAHEWVQVAGTPALTGETVVRPEQRLRVHRSGGEVQEVVLDAVLVPRPGPDGRPLGTISVLTDVTRRVAERDAARRELADLRTRDVAARAGVAALQRALLPDVLPLLPDFDVAARYALAADDGTAGGDWFDAVPCGDGSVVLVVGDVVGHGAGAAVAMGQLRNVLLSQLTAGAGVAEALRFLDGFAAGVPAARRATVCVARVDPAGDVEYCTAGHPPPLVLATEAARSRYLLPSGAGPLASGGGFATARAHLRVGEVVVLYSDGILERPGTRPGSAAVELLAAAQEALQDGDPGPGTPRSAAERLCAVTIDLLTRASGTTDDITLLALQRRPAVPDLDVALATGPASLREARTALRSWLDLLGAGVDDVERLVSATTELVANVVDHAHLGGRPAPFRVRARLEGSGHLVVDVVDTGSWKFPVVTSGRGRGLALVRRLVDGLEVRRSPHGTTATIRHLVHRPAGLLPRTTSAAPVAPAADPEFFDVWSRGGPEPVVAVVGPLDAAGTAEAAGHLALALTEAGAVVTVDLTRTTLLASAGVDLLFRVLEQARDVGLAVSLVAPAGSPAQHVLSLVRLPHVQGPGAGS